MIDFDKWREIFDSLSRHKLRTFLTALSVWWGIFMLVILLGAGNGLQNSVERSFRDDAINSIWVWPGKTSEPYKGLPAGRRISWENSEFAHILNTVDGIEYSSGRYYLSGETSIVYKNQNLSFDIRSVHPGHKVLENTIMRTGRFINEIDIEKKRKVCSIGKLVVEGFFKKEEDPIGKYLKIKGIDYQIVGTFEDAGHENEMRKIYLPISTAQRVDGGRDRIHQMMFTIGDASVAESKKIEAKIVKELATLNKFSPEDDQAMYIRNGVERFNEFQTVFAFIKGFIWFVGIGSIIAGVIGVSNIMLIIVKDRTREIGIRKAMGATPYSIISMILQEAILLTSIAGYFGVLTGFGLVYGLRTFMEQNEIETEFFYNPEVDFTNIIAALVLLVICGTLAGLIPALQAVRINPIEAMKT